MQIDINTTVQGDDLAELLRGNSGTFFCRQSGQPFIAVAAEGHSIKLLKPIGPATIDVTALSTTVQPWVVTKLSNSDLSSEFSSVGYGARREQRQT